MTQIIPSNKFDTIILEFPETIEFTVTPYSDYLTSDIEDFDVKLGDYIFFITFTIIEKGEKIHLNSKGIHIECYSELTCENIDLSEDQCDLIISKLYSNITTSI